MSWGRAKLKKVANDPSKRSEEIDEIIDRMPMAFGRWVAIAIVIFTILLLLFGWIIKYPDTVTGQIKINAQNSSIRLVANSSGNLHIFPFKVQDEIKKGDYIAVIQNTAHTQDVKKIASLIDEIDLSGNFLSNDAFPDKISLGDLNSKYYTFLSALKTQSDYETKNIYEQQKQNFMADIKWKNKVLEEAEEMLKTTEQRYEISQKWLNRYTSLNKNEIATYEYEVDQAKNNHLAITQEVQSIKREIVVIKMQITESYNKIRQLNIEQKEKERNLKLDILASFQDLKGNIAAWEQKYVFKAPLNGKLEYLKFLADGQFIQTGEEVFGIIPQENHIFGQVLLPANGAGKVKKGSRVAIKLDNYPYMEYGYIEGYVSSVSLISQPQKTEKSTIDTYLINVLLPNGLKTNYGEILDFKYEIGGTADIIIKERRLIERLFDNLKYSTH